MNLTCLRMVLFPISFVCSFRGGCTWGLCWERLCALGGWRSEFLGWVRFGIVLLA